MPDSEYHGVHIDVLRDAFSARGVKIATLSRDRLRLARELADVKADHSRTTRARDLWMNRYVRLKRDMRILLDN